MNLHDPATWPQHPGLFYRRASQYREIAHAFYEGTTAVCNAVTLGPGGGARPKEQSAAGGHLCSNCIGWLRKQGYLSTSEAVYAGEGG